tara:strand:- start:4908 stop:5276 length:369 start_codon:yes stop_codon:yes gene_type:complete
VVKDVGALNELAQGNVAQGHDDSRRVTFDERVEMFYPTLLQGSWRIGASDIIAWWATPHGIGNPEIFAVESCSGDTVIQHSACCPYKGTACLCFFSTQRLPNEKDTICALPIRGHEARANDA